MATQEEIMKLALSYYSRKDILSCLFKFSQNRETIPRYFEGFGKRPDTFQYPNDLISFVKKGATSFHTSEEIWEDPLQVSTELNQIQLNNLRQGWDLLIDIDSKYLDYSKIAAQLIIDALAFHRVKNVGIKFSGSKGFHIIVPWQAFPEEFNEIKTNNMFPEWPRAISLYLTNFIKGRLIEKVSATQKMSKYVKDFEAPKKVMPDIILVSPRHLFRMPYSLHEKTKLVSIVIDKNKLKDFEIQDAHPLKAQIKDFIPSVKRDEAKELLSQALSWQEEQEKAKQETKTIYNEVYRGEYKGKNKEIKLAKKELSQEIYPPCISSILNGLEDGRKRAVFILINFYRSLGLTLKEAEEIITEWNKKNKPPLKEGYIRSQLSWAARQKVMLPPNCDKDYYKGIGVCGAESDETCKLIKNPVNYAIKQYLGKNRKIKQRK